VPKGVPSQPDAIPGKQMPTDLANVVEAWVDLPDAISAMLLQRQKHGSQRRLVID
jgi:hypothetical protein